MRGGKREGAGRKPVLRWIDRIHIGALCDNYQRDLRIGKALAREKDSPELEAARARLKGRGGKEIQRLIKIEIAPLMRGRRGVKIIPLRREKTRAEIISLVARSCASTPGMQMVTPRRVEACWKEYRAFLNSARVSEGGKG